MTGRKEYEIKTIYCAVVAVFAFFLAVPVLRLLAESFASEAGAGIANYISVLTGKGFLTALGHSAAVSIASAVTATAIAFFLAYTIQYTNVPPVFKSLIRTLATLPILLPTITYGFAIIYSFGKQGLLTRLFGRQIFEIYGFGGLLFGYVIYTLPVSFLLILNTMRYIDKKFSVVSRVMGYKPLKTFLQTVARPLLGTLAASMVQCFFLCFTDYGIPASVGGRYDVVATVLYNEMLGSVPDFNRGAVVAMMMLIPSAVSIALLRWLEKYNIRYSKISTVEIRKNRLRDGVFFAGSSVFLLGLLSVFAVIFVVPLVSEWPYQTSFTLEHVISTLTDRSLTDVYQNSLLVAVCTAAGGLLVTCGSALATARSGLNSRLKAVIDGIALVTNTIPGMVVGIAFLFIFTEYADFNYYLQYRTLFFDAVSDDEKFAVKAQQLLGGHGVSHGRQLVSNYCADYHSEHGLHASGGIRILLCKRYGNRQRGYLHRRSENHGHYHKNQGAAVLYEV